MSSTSLSPSQCLLRTRNHPFLLILVHIRARRQTQASSKQAVRYAVLLTMRKVGVAFKYGLQM